MNITPISILKGRNSDGSSFRVAQWDFNTISNMETTGLLVGLVVGLIASSVIAPIILLVSLLNFNGRLNLGFILSAIISGYFLIDCNNGWITLSALNIFFSETTINFLVAMNTATLLLNLILIVFGGAIYSAITVPVKDINELDAKYLNESELNNINQALNKRWLVFGVVVFMVAVFGFAIGKSTTSKHSGWVETVLVDADAKQREQEEQDKLDEVGSYGSKEERDAHFDRLEKEWGN